MTLYHVNPATGNPGQCRAEQACPFGSAEDHFASKEEARAAFEDAQEGAEWAGAEAAVALAAEERALTRSVLTELQERNATLTTDLNRMFPEAAPPLEDAKAYSEERQAFIRRLRLSKEMELGLIDELQPPQSYAGATGDRVRVKNAILDLEEQELLEEQRRLPKETFANRKSRVAMAADLDRRLRNVQKDRERLGVSA